MTEPVHESQGSANLQAALGHAAAGRPVFPCAQDKRPAIAKRDGGRGFHDATTDEAQVRQWWARYPDALVGMPTGEDVGVFVVDVDVKAGKIGAETLAQLVDTFGTLPDTVEAITATGGQHLYFRHPRDGRSVPNKGSLLGLGTETWGRGGYPSVPFAVSPGGLLQTPDVDIRGDGGYVILPGSLLADGSRYEWEGSSDPDEGIEVAVAPDWLLALVARVPEEQSTTAPSGEDAPIASGARNETLFSLGRSLRAKGLTAAGIEAALLAENAARCVPPLPDQEVRATAQSAASKPPGRSAAFERRAGAGEEKRKEPPMAVVGGTDYEPCTVIQVVNGALPANVDAAEKTLLKVGADIYQHGNRVVRVGRWEQAKQPVKRPTEASVLLELSPEWMVDKLTQVIRWERYDKRADAWLHIDAPLKIAKTLLARCGEWNFPHLLGFCDSPTLALDGRVIASPGYDSASGLYLSFPPRLEPMGSMSRRAAEGARGVLEELVSTFQFVSNDDRSACLALMMTAILRRVLPAAPIGCVSASTPGTGKSLLVDCVSALATGRKAAVLALGKDNEELEKRIDSVLLKGDLLCSFDNVDRAVKSDVLCQVATQELKSVRVLSQSRMVDLPTNVYWMMTGNNLTLLGDLTRRSLMVHLDPGGERPELRTFTRDAIGHVLRYRAEGIRAVLMIAKAYIDAGCPDVGASPFGGFEVWDRMVRRPLMWAGMPDPLLPAQSMREEDHDLVGMRDFMIALHNAVGDEPKTAAEIYELVNQKAPAIGDKWGPLYPELHDAYVSILGSAPRIGPRELGYKLRAWSGRLISTYRILPVRKSKAGVRWRVVVGRQTNG